MKIALINDQHPYAGITIHSMEICNNLRKHSISCDFYQFNLEPNPENSPEIKRVNGLLSKVKSTSSLSYYSKLAVNFLTGLNWKSFKSIDADVILLSGPTLLPLTKYYDNIIAEGHDLYFLKELPANPVLKIYMKKMYRLYNKANFIIADSRFTLNEFINHLKVDRNKIGVTYGTFNPLVFHPGKSSLREKIGIEEDNFVVLSVGGDSPNKNVESIIKVIKGLPNNFKLLRIGRNFRFTRMIERLGLKDRVIATGNVSTDFLADAYRASDVLLFPSLFEGFGIPVVEAMASGLPVIVSNRGSLPEVAGDAGIVVEPLDIDAMVSYIRKLSTENHTYEDFRFKGLKRLQDFTEEKQFESLYRILKKLVQDGFIQTDRT
jgi:glycosyltransferase involved in cell wall biosynthesis